jgi:hypothetical protein
MGSKIRRTAGMIECKLASSKRQTAFGPLCLLGHYLAKERVLEPLSSVRIAQETVRYSPTQKLTDALMGILAGCKDHHTRAPPGCSPETTQARDANGCDPRNPPHIP